MNNNLRWLYFAVHGTRPPLRRRRPRRGPARDWKYRAWIRSFPCVACGALPRVEAAHTGDHGISQKASDYSAIPLCRHCHTTGPYAYHVIGRVSFERWHNISIKDIVDGLNREWRERG